MNLENRTAIVTGASRGIGRQLTIDLARRGVTVAALARSATDLAATMRAAERHLAGGMALPCDVTDPDAVSAAVEQVVERYGHIDLLVCNAGIGTFTSPVEASLAHMRSIMEVNYWGAVHVVKAALPAMVRRGQGHIVFVASIGGKHGFPRQAAYSASKFALIGFAESLSLDLEAVGIDVSIVNPGPVDTPFFQHPALAELRTLSSRMAIPAERVSAAIIRAVERRSFEVTVPGHLRLPAIARALLPSLFRRGLLLFARRNGIVWRPGHAPAAGAVAAGASEA